MKLNQEQLAQLQAFIKQKGFTYIDVQMEILDHVASSVEEKMTNNPDLKFDDALNQTHKSFGIFGFSSIEDAIIKGMDKKYRKIFFSNLLYFFKPKYLPITLFIIFLVYKAQSFTKTMNLMLIVFIIIIIAIIVYLVLFYLKKTPYKKYMVVRISASYLVLLGSFLSLISILGHQLVKPHNYYGINVNFLAVALLIVMFYIYVASAVKTARTGIKESDLLADKYNKLTMV